MGGDLDLVADLRGLLARDVLFGFSATVHSPTCCDAQRSRSPAAKRIEYLAAQDTAAALFKAARCTVWLDFDLAVGLSPMADSGNINNPLSVIDAVNNSVVSNSDTPQALFSL